jgi:hypothetical protein
VLGQPANDPIIVKIIPPASDISTLGDVLLGALGITGVLVLGAVVFGVVLAGVMFLVRRRSSSDHPNPFDRTGASSPDS